MRTTTGKMFYSFLALGLAIVLLWLLLRQADIPKLLLIISNSNIYLLLLSTLIFLCSFFIRMMRWKYILKKFNENISLKKCFAPYFSSFALNNVLPFRLGDISRATLFNKHTGVSPSEIVSSLLIERIIDLSTLLILFYISLQFLTLDILSDEILFYVISVSSLIMSLIFLLIIFPAFWLKLLDWLTHKIYQKSSGLIYKSIHFIRQTIHSFYKLGGIQPILILLSYSILTWLLEAATFGLIAMAMGINLAILDSIFVMSTATLSSLLPSTPGYIGTFDYLCHLALSFFTVDNNAALATAFIVHIINILPITLIGGWAFIHHFGKAWKEKLDSSLKEAAQ